MVSKISKNLSRKSSLGDVLASKVKKILETPVLINPNFLLDILVKFILLASFIYILYKYFLIDMTIKYIMEQMKAHINIYIEDFKIFLNSLMSITDFQEYLNNQINLYAKEPSTKDSTANDTNFAIIFATFVIVLFIVIAGIIIITGGVNKIDYKNLIYTIVLNLVIIVISQIVFFYLIYSYFDPIKLYKFFYYDYKVEKVQTPTAGATTTTKPQPSGTGITRAATTTSIIANDNPLNKPRDIIIDSRRTGSIYIFLLIFLILFLMLGIVTIFNVMLVYFNYSIPYLPLPLNKFTLSIYGTLTVLFLFLFIIMTLLISNRL